MSYRIMNRATDLDANSNTKIEVIYRIIHRRYYYILF
jgi:hypothetical protein